MKKIALILAVVMMLSAVSVLAAPSLDHIFYDEEDGNFYMFGQFRPSYYGATDLGVYINGTKYSYVKDGDKTNINWANNSANDKRGKFGMSFGAPLTYFDTLKVAPYLKDASGEKISKEYEFDFETKSKKASSNAYLSEISIHKNNVHQTSEQGYYLTPAWDPENVKDYEIKGVFLATAGNSFNPEKTTITVKAADPDAIVEQTTTAATIYGSGENYVTTFKVTAPDRVTTEEYTFSFKKVTPTCQEATNNACILYKDANKNNIVAPSNMMDIQEYLTSNDSKSLLFTLPITSDMATKNGISFNLNLNAYTTLEFKNVNIGLREVTLKDGYTYNASTLTYQNSIEEGNLVVGDLIGTTCISEFRVAGVGSLGNLEKLLFDVTDYVHKALEKGETSITVMLSIDSFDIPDGTSAPTNNLQIRVLMNNYSYPAHRPSLVY